MKEKLLQSLVEVKQNILSLDQQNQDTINNTLAAINLEIYCLVHNTLTNKDIREINETVASISKLVAFVKDTNFIGSHMELLTLEREGVIDKYLNNKVSPYSDEELTPTNNLIT